MTTATGPGEPSVSQLRPDDRPKPQRGLRRSIRLLFTAFRVVRDEPSLLSISTVAAAIEGLITFGILLVILRDHTELAMASRNHLLTRQEWTLAAVGLVLVTLVSITSQATNVVRSLSLLRGEPLSNLRSWLVVLGRFHHVVGLAVSTFVLRLISPQMPRLLPGAGPLGTFVGAKRAVSWRCGSQIALPSMMADETIGPFAALSRSGAIITERWPGDIVGVAAFGSVHLVFVVALCGAGLLGAFVVPVLGVVLAGLGLILLLLSMSVAAASFSVALFTFATESAATLGFTAEDLLYSIRYRDRPTKTSP